MKVNDIVFTPYGQGIILSIRNVEGTKHQSSKRNKIDYLIKFTDGYIDWFEDYNTKPIRKLRVDEAYDLRGRIKRVKRVGIYNSKTLYVSDYYLFYDEDEVYHLEYKKNGKIVLTFSANCKEDIVREVSKFIFPF